MPHLPIFIAVTRRRLRNDRYKGRRINTIRHEQASQLHTDTINEKLQDIGVPPCHMFAWHRPARASETMTAIDPFWSLRYRHAGAIVGLVLVQTPGEWRVGPLDLRTEEHRMWSDLAPGMLAFFDIKDAVCIGDFAGSAEPGIDVAELYIHKWDHKHNKIITEVREDVAVLGPMPWVGLTCTAA